MPVHLDPRQQPVNRVTSTHGDQPAIFHERRRFFGDTLEVRQEVTNSFLECINNCFKAIYDFFKRLFSKEPAKEKAKEGANEIAEISLTRQQEVNDPRYQARAEAPAAREVPEPMVSKEPAMEKAKEGANE